MGDQSEDVFASFQLSEEEAGRFETVIASFDGYFIPRRNVIFERARFNTRVQQEGESVEEFATALHSLSKHCEYGEMQEQFVRDRLVVGIRDKKLSAKLQLDSDLTLRKALESTRQVESVRQQQAELTQDGKSNGSVNKLSSGSKQAKQSSRGTTGDRATHTTEKFAAAASNSKSTAVQEKQSCNWCGRKRHSRRSCPARYETCKNCGKKGHYASVCLSKRVNHVSGSDDEIGFIGGVSNPEADKWELGYDGAPRRPRQLQN